MTTFHNTVVECKQGHAPYKKKSTKHRFYWQSIGKEFTGLSQELDEPNNLQLLGVILDLKNGLSHHSKRIAVLQSVKMTTNM